jgi:hypothetical protein
VLLDDPVDVVDGGLGVGAAGHGLHGFLLGVGAAVPSAHAAAKYRGAAQPARGGPVAGAVQQQGDTRLSSACGYVLLRRP